jgi:hypothetical protein
MKTIKYPLILGIAGLISYSANAQDATTAPITATTAPPVESTTPPPDGDSGWFVGKFYRDHEISFDGFAVGEVGQQTLNHFNSESVAHHGHFGAGGGVNVFFCRYLGIGADAYSVNTTGPFIDSASGNLIARLPIANTGLAPYIFGGGGYQFDSVHQSFEQAGAGLEFRFMEHAGIFIDARYVFADKTENYGVGRAGLRINF